MDYQLAVNYALRKGATQQEIDLRRAFKCGV